MEGSLPASIYSHSEMGRDILARILWGSRTTLFISLCALAVAFVFGTTLGTAAAYYRRFADTLIMRFIDIVMSIPPILLMITLATIMTPSTISLIFVVGLGLVPNQSRMIRGQVLQVVDNEYIEVVRIQGARRPEDHNVTHPSERHQPHHHHHHPRYRLRRPCHQHAELFWPRRTGAGPQWGSMPRRQAYIRYAWHITTFPDCTCDNAYVTHACGRRGPRRA